MPEPAARGFSARADLYEARRPSYPAEAVAWLLAELQLDRTSRIVDVGAGTGKLTRQIVDAGLSHVVALEPLAAMCAQLTGVVDAPVVRAVAEAIPLRSHSVDAVLAAQAFHWFDHELALAEIHRVLRPGGGVGLIWNMRDERYDWVARLGDVRRRYGDIRYDSGRWREAFESNSRFEPLVERQFSYEQALDPEGVVELMASRSYIAALEPNEHWAVREELRQLLARHPETAGREVLVLPYRTDVSWTRSVR